MSDSVWKYRVYLIVPNSRKAGLNEFIRQEFDNADWIAIPLSVNGSEPATYWMTSFACTHEQTSTWATRLTSEGGIPLPPEFAQMDVDARIAFMEAAYPTLKSLTGVVVRVCRNDVMPWTLDVDTVLQTENLKRVENNSKL